MKLKGFPAGDKEKAKRIAAKEKFAKIMDKEAEKAAAKSAGQHCGRLSRLQSEVLKNSPPPVKSLQSLQSEVVVGTFIKSVRQDMVRDAAQLKLGFKDIPGGRAF